MTIIICFLLFLGNILIFYSPIETLCPKFLFRIRMFIKEIIEGIICIFVLFIPKCEKKRVVQN